MKIRLIFSFLLIFLPFLTIVEANVVAPSVRIEKCDITMLIHEKTFIPHTSCSASAQPGRSSSKIADKKLTISSDDLISEEQANRFKFLSEYSDEKYDLKKQNANDITLNDTDFISETDDIDKANNELGLIKKRKKNNDDENIYPALVQSAITPAIQDASDNDFNDGLNNNSERNNQNKNSRNGNNNDDIDNENFNDNGIDSNKNGNDDTDIDDKRNDDDSNTGNGNSNQPSTACSRSQTVAACINAKNKTTAATDNNQTSTKSNTKGTVQIHHNTIVITKEISTPEQNKTIVFEVKGGTIVDNQESNIPNSPKQIESNIQTSTISTINSNVQNVPTVNPGTGVNATTQTIHSTTTGINIPPPGNTVNDTLNTNLPK